MSDAPVSLRQAHKYLRKLDVKSPCVLLIKKGCSLADDETIKILSAALNSQGIKGVIVVAEDLSDLRTVDERTMRAAGWILLESLIKKRQIPIRTEP